MLVNYLTGATRTLEDVLFRSQAALTDKVPNRTYVAACLLNCPNVADLSLLICPVRVIFGQYQVDVTADL